ncbi:MAG: hypothetical protein ACHQ50_01845 [Fimbriimonadales bacterium]
MQRVFKYRTWTRITGALFFVVLGLWALGYVLLPLLRGQPVVFEGDTSALTQASHVEVIILLGLSVALVVAGTIHLVYAYRAEVVVDPLGIAAYGFGINPRFFAGWSEITTIEIMSTDSGSWMRLRAGRRKVDLPTNIESWDELRALIESRVPSHVRVRTI